MTRFERLLVVAHVGAFLAFLPLLVLLLPRRVEAVTNGEGLTLLSLLLLAGAVTASIANIFAGAVSDRWIERHGNRRGLIAIGLVLVMLAYWLLAVATSPPALFAGIVALQASFNLMFAPLGVLLADHVPDARKGLVAGGMNMALPLAGFGVAALGWLSGADAAWPFALVAFAVAILTLPLLIFWPPTGAPLTAPDAGPRAPRLSLLEGDFARAFAGRLLVQLGAASIIGYLFLYVDSVARTLPDFAAADSSAGVASMTLLANLVGLVAGLAAGKWSDRLARRRPPLVASALAGAAALAILAWAPSWPLVVIAYALFTAALTAFLSVDAALVAQLVQGRASRGALLGVMNLTNTLPAILAPLVALGLAGQFEGGTSLKWLLALAAVASALAALFIARIRSVA